MKKLLLASVAVSGLAFAAAPAHAEGVELELGGHFKGYGVYVNEDELVNTEVRNFDVAHETEIHFGGETTLDNGLTVGAHFEVDTDEADADLGIDENYVYFSGNWGRVNFGVEDGAAYLLQVAAPSADSNYDGIVQYVNPVQYSIIDNTNLTAIQGTTTTNTLAADLRFDYDQSITGKSAKLTYLTPIMNGFQGGISYTPEVDYGTRDNGLNGLAGNSRDNFEDDPGSAYEVGLRYEGQLQSVGVIVGGGYSHIETENDTDNTNDDADAWNLGADLDIGAFGIGLAYVDSDVALKDSGTGAGALDTQTWVLGADYTTGPFKIGASYYDQDAEEEVAGGLELDVQRYTGGVVYTYGPGMTFRGTLSYIDIEDNDATAGTDDVDATSLMLGTQINF